VCWWRFVASAVVVSCGIGEIDNGSLGSKSDAGRTTSATTASASATTGRTTTAETSGAGGSASGGQAGTGGASHGGAAGSDTGGNNVAGGVAGSPSDAGADGAVRIREAGRDTGPVPVTGFSQLVTREMYETMFPKQIEFYDYAGLVQETVGYPEFANTGDIDQRKREAAAFLANVGHETIDLVYIEEIEKGPYCSGESGECACQPGKQYFGRGPLQISWNSNYCTAGKALSLPLLADPDLVGRDRQVAWRTALWFWMTQNGAGNMTGHAAMTTGAGFGETIRSINGAIECGGNGTMQVQDRVQYYLRFTQMLGVDTGAGRVDC
jgi:predicted chitinase